jgi:penicillin-insensitive murein endopeptidase
MPSKTIALSALAAIVTVATGASPGASAQRATSARMNLETAALRFGRSLGSPTEGRLVGGTHLDETAYVRVMPADAPGDVRWGLEPLVEMIDRAARAVRRQFPGAVTSVGHLSREGGGELDQHRSHESGRDADVGFFVHSGSGRQLLPSHFVPFRADGSTLAWPGAYFDDARNWALVAALVTDRSAHVTHLFVASPLRARLLEYAERNGVDSTVRMRAAEVMQQPHGALPHDDHFHVRIACPVHMSGCVENPSPRLVVLTKDNRSRRLVTRAPSRKETPAAVPPLPADRPDDEPRAPPASLPARLDDVDG